MSIRTRIIAAAVVTAAAASPLVVTALPAHATPTSNATTASTSAKAGTHSFGQTVTVDGFKVTATYKNDGRLPKGGEISGYTEKVTVHVTPTAHHKAWTPNDGWKDAARYGKNYTKQAGVVSSSVFQNKQPWVESERFATNKSHYAHHFEYTFTFRGKHITWAK